MKKFYLGALGCLMALGASAQKFDQVGTMQGEIWSLYSIPTEYAYDGKSSVYTINDEAETGVEFTVYNKSFAVDRTIKVDHPTSYYRTVVESREPVLTSIEMGSIECGDKNKLYLSYDRGYSYSHWWAINKCNNTTYTADYVPQWFEYMKTERGYFEGVAIVSKIDYDGGTLFVTDQPIDDGAAYALYFKDNQLISVSYLEGAIINAWDQGRYDELYYLIYNMLTAEFTQDNIVEYINLGQSIYFEDGYLYDYRVDSIATEVNGNIVFYTNKYNYYDGKEYPILKFVWNKSTNALTAIATAYTASYTGEWYQELKEGSYEEDEWLWDAEMYPFCVGELMMEIANGLYATQTLFNNDEKWEFLRPIYTEAIRNTIEADRDHDGEVDYKEIRYGNKLKAYEIVSEDGNVLSSFLVPEGHYYEPIIIKWDGETYFGISVEKKIDEDGDYYYNYETFTVVYSIDKNASSVKKIAETPAMRVSPALAERNSIVNVTIDAETAKNGGELIITDSNGRTVGRSHVEAGQTSVSVTTDRMASGVYNITLTEKGQKMENARIIVK